MTALAVAGASLRRMLRDRTSLLFIVLLPVLIIAIIGTVVQNPGGFRIGVLNGQSSSPALAAALTDDLAAAGPVQTLTDEEAARTALRRGELDAVVLIPPELDTTLLRGDDLAIPVLAGGAESTQAAVRSAIAAAVARHAERIQAAAFAARTTGSTVAEQLPTAAAVQQVTPRITVSTENVASGSDYLPLGFGYSAPTMLVLFVFINALAGGAAIVQTRQLGIYNRALAAPIRARTLVLGETLCYLTFSLLQSALIIGTGSLLFGVGWGNLPAAIALVVTWALVGTGAGMLSGALFKTPDQASAIGPVIGIAFAMLGGCMWPLEIVPDAVRTVGHATPHAWAVDAWITLLSRAGGIADIGTELAVLAGFALGMLVLASTLLQRRLST
ncbi:ABC-2 type transport system permease protein [Kribbella orskensis]|uniref:ABC-2 type transport system permease protein n=1 Tax=Kribbella orskensis TaxID=2512216 RepID=A0ABY2B6Y2_9ACTN|nr:MULTISPECIES: ABC transporter permease [Kribbella]TCN29621.1 ABC-2 type transport system permease protein [Kribbella sp. VKM Ac-2500]TCO09945.1 ABC-2 type transport system permease protein [Kribbella orskensis]